MTLKSWDGGATPTTLAEQIDDTQTSFSVTDAASWPDGSVAPFVITLDRLGVVEKVLVASRLGNALSGVTRGHDGTTPAIHLAGVTAHHTIDAETIAEANTHANDTGSRDDHPGYLTSARHTLESHAGIGVQLGATGSTAAAGNHKHVLWVPHTWAIGGTIAVPSGDTDFIIPFTVPVPSGQVVEVVGYRAKINSGTSVSCKVQKNGSDLTGFTGISVTTTDAGATPTAQACADNDALALVVTAVSGTPKNLKFTLKLRYTTFVPS